MDDQIKQRAAELINLANTLTDEQERVADARKAYELSVISAHAARNPGSFMSAAAEMPRYQCHKQVHALKIAGISFPQNEAGDAELAFADEGYAPKLMPRAWLDKHNPEVGGYLVVYDDGYQSFSPAKAFEEGYTRL